MRPQLAKSYQWSLPLPILTSLFPILCNFGHQLQPPPLSSSLDLQPAATILPAIDLQPAATTSSSYLVTFFAPVTEIPVSALLHLYFVRPAAANCRHSTVHAQLSRPRLALTWPLRPSLSTYHNPSTAPCFQHLLSLASLLCFLLSCDSFCNLHHSQIAATSATSAVHSFTTCSQPSPSVVVCSNSLSCLLLSSRPRKRPN
ncbi:hypothetical protein AMTRI_Chr03g48360 [Amborella trichopoda]